MITIKKAIHRLQQYVKYRKPDPDDNFHEAVQVGIEGLKLIQGYRKTGILYAGFLLPGETKE